MMLCFVVRPLKTISLLGVGHLVESSPGEQAFAKFEGLTIQAVSSTSRGNETELSAQVDPEDISTRSLVIQNECAATFQGYVFWPTYDSVGNDLKYMKPSDFSIASMVAECSANIGCKGVVTTGYIKSSIKPLRMWQRFTSDQCAGLYIKIPTSFKVNNNSLYSKEVINLKWIAQWTVSNFGMSRYTAIRDYLGMGTWWALKEGVLNLSNAFNHNNCNFVNGDRVIGPLEECPVGRAWQVGIAGVQVPNVDLSTVQPRATSVSGMDVKAVLGRSAQQAGYNPGTSTYNAIVASQGNVTKAWLLKWHLVGFYFVKNEVANECLRNPPKSWCYGTYGGKCISCARYSPNAASIQAMIDQVTVLLQSLTNGAGKWEPLLMTMPTTGTASGGVAVSQSFAKDDYKYLTPELRAKFERVGRKLDFPLALIAGIASRESRMGSILGSPVNSNPGWGDNNNAFGILQVDKRANSPLKGLPDPYSEEHILQAIGIFASFRTQVAKDHQDWPEKYLLKGAVVAYNSGPDNVRTIKDMDKGTTGNDYGSDVVARAQWYYLNGLGA